MNFSSWRATLRAKSGTEKPSFSRYLASEIISDSSGAKFTTNSQFGGRAMYVRVNFSLPVFLQINYLIVYM